MPVCVNSMVSSLNFDPYAFTSVTIDAKFSDKTAYFIWKLWLDADILQSNGLSKPYWQIMNIKAISLSVPMFCLVQDTTRNWLVFSYGNEEIVSSLCILYTSIPSTLWAR